MRWALILGASSGLGEATARAFAAHGHPIFGVHLDRRAEQSRVDSLVDELRALGVEAVFCNGNAARDATRAEMLDHLCEAMGPEDTVGTLVHSLAFGALLPMFSVDGDALSRRQLEMTTDVMANSLVFWTRDLVERGLLREGGRVLALTSSGSLAALPSYGAVSAAKCALESHVRQMAVELAPLAITANAIMAGATRTPAAERIPGFEQLLERARARNPHGRLTTPEDVASCLVALSGPGTSWMTGNVVRVDGGETIAG